MPKPHVIFLMGPTAAGKTAAAMHLADHIKTRLISVDSALIYRSMDIGTAKPTLAEQRAYPHALIDIIEPEASYSAAEFIKDASREIKQAHQESQLPVLVGGTLLYFKALMQGLSPTPPANPKVRAQIQQRIHQDGENAAYAWLQSLDPETAARLHPKDQQRIERALEIYLSSGTTMSSNYTTDYFQKGWDQICLEHHQWDILPIAYAPSIKQELHPRIEQRLEAMLDAGFLDEVRTLMARPELTPELPSMRCVGYRQAWAHLNGDISYTEFFDQANAATRQLAKRQMTWLRNWSTAHWIDALIPEAPQTLLNRVNTFLDLH